MQELGCVHLVMSLISRAKDPRRIGSYLSKILPEVVKLGGNLLALGT